MDDMELQKIWKGIDSTIESRTKEEIQFLLNGKARQTINKLLAILSLSVIVSGGLILFLIFTSLQRQNDAIYLLNNLLLGIITIISFLSGIVSWYKIRNNRYNKPLKEWLDERIRMLTRWTNGKFSRLYLYLMPFLYLLTVSSIHVYYENKLFSEVLKTEESIIGLIVAAPIGLFVSYYGAGKIRKYESAKLEFLKDLYNRLCKI